MRIVNEAEMKQVKVNKKRITALALSMMLVLQQSFAMQVLATTITNADGSTIAGNNGTWNIGPDAVNDATKTGYKQFGEINLSQGDVLNLIYRYLPQRGVNISWNEANGSNDTNITLTTQQDIDTFIALVNSGVNINGIVNINTTIYKYSTSREIGS